MFAVVEFQNSQCSIVPITWLLENGQKCYWPKSVKSNEEFNSMVSLQKPFSKSWPKYKVSKILLKTSKYQEAEIKLEKLLQNVESEDSCTSVMSRKRVYISDGEDTSSDSEVVNSLVATPTSEKSFFSDMSTKSRATPTSDTAPLSTPTKSTFQETVLKMLTKLEGKVDQQSVIVNEILKNHKEINIQSLQKPSNVPNFPLNSMMDFENFESLLNREDIYGYMVNRLAAVGGSGADSHTRRILKFLIADEIALKYNWKGRDKISFQKTKTMDLIYNAVKKSFKMEGNDLLIENAVKDWLKYAKTRILAENKRRYGKEKRLSLSSQENE